MKTPHKHAELIKQWANGAEIEWKYTYHVDGWRPAGHPNWDAEYVEYRIKPEPKPDVVNLYFIENPYCRLANKKDGPNLKLTFSGETGKLKSAEVL